jgi:hypothetical protein
MLLWRDGQVVVPIHAAVHRWELLLGHREHDVGVQRVVRSLLTGPLAARTGWQGRCSRQLYVRLGSTNREVPTRADTHGLADNTHITP